MGTLDVVHKKLGVTSELRCVVMLGIAFMLVFTGFDTQAYITEIALHSVSVREPGRIGPHSGYYGMCITYFVFTLSTMVTPIIVDSISAKWSMFLASILYSTFMVAFLFINDVLFYFTSALMGLAAALVWTGHGVYLKEITTPGNETRNSGLHWSINFCSLIIGGFLLLIIFSVIDKADILSMSVIRYIFGGLSFFTIMSCILFALLPNYCEKNTKKRESFGVLIGRNLKLFGDVKTCLLAVCFLYMGLSLSFYITIFPSCLSFSKSMIGYGNEIIAYYAIITALAQILGGSVISLVSKWIKNFGYLPTAIISMPIHLTAFLGIYLAFPIDANLKPTSGFTHLKPSLALWMAIGFLIGVGDGCWNTLRTAILTKVYDHNDSARAFALSKFFQSAATSGLFFFAAKINLHQQMVIMSVMLVISVICFAITWHIHMREETTQKKQSISIIAKTSDLKINNYS